MSEYNFNKLKYPRPPLDSGVGIHGGANAWHCLGENQGLYKSMLQVLKEWGMSWFKVLDVDGVSYNACRVMLEMGIMPVVRLYRTAPNPGTLLPKQRESVLLFRSIGVYYFERNNEPNLTWEWSAWPGAFTEAVFDRQAQDWYTDAQFIASAGGLTAIDACSPGGDYDDITYTKNFIKSLKKIPGISEFLRNHAWIAVHPAGLNHPLNYPDDAINQKEHPGQTIHTHYYPNGSPTGASNCARKWEAVGKIFYDEFGFIIPVMATEGSFWSGSRQDGRYPELNQYTASDANFDLLHAMQGYPSWYMANMPWLLSNRLFGNKDEAFERDSWWRIPGWGNCPTSEKDKLPICDMLKANPVTDRGTTLNDTILTKAHAEVLPLNPIAGLEKAANLVGDGRLPASREFTVEFGGSVYVCQVFRKASDRNTQYVAYCKYGDWENVVWISQAN